MYKIMVKITDIHSGPSYDPCGTPLCCKSLNIFQTVNDDTPRISLWKILP